MVAEPSEGNRPGKPTPAHCTICDKSFSRFWSLQRHLADTHFYTPMDHDCDVCGRSYRSRNSLVSHRSQYHGTSKLAPRSDPRGGDWANPAVKLERAAGFSDTFSRKFLANSKSEVGQKKSEAGLKKSEVGCR